MAKNEEMIVTKELHEVEFSLEEIELGGHEHFMAKEIFEQPQSLANTLRGRLNTREGTIHLGGIAAEARALARAKRIIFTAQGTAWHAGLVGEYLFEAVLERGQAVDTCVAGVLRAGLFAKVRDASFDVNTKSHCQAGVWIGIDAENCLW